VCIYSFNHQSSINISGYDFVGWLDTMYKETFDFDSDFDFFNKYLASGVTAASD